MFKYIAIKVEMSPKEVKSILKKLIEKEDMATYDLEHFTAKQIGEKYFISSPTSYRKIYEYRASKKSPI